jgi:hypothetical protein
MSRLSTVPGDRRALADPAPQDAVGRHATSASCCCKTGELNRRLDQALEQSFPVEDTMSLTEPVGDARDVVGCGCAASGDAAPAVVDRSSGCCGAARAAKRTEPASR